MNLPNDRMMLLSVINTKLRDNYKSLDELCEDLNEDKNDIISKLKEIDYEYNEELKRFV